MKNFLSFFSATTFRLRLYLAQRKRVKKLEQQVTELEQKFIAEKARTKSAEAAADSYAKNSGASNNDRPDPSYEKSFIDACIEEIERLKKIINYKTGRADTKQVSSRLLQALDNMHYDEENYGTGLIGHVRKFFATEEKRRIIAIKGEELRNSEARKIRQVLKDGTLIFDRETNSIHGVQYAKESERSVKIDDKHVRVYKLEKLPTELSPAAISNMLQASLPLKISQYITVNTTAHLRSNLARQINTLRLLDDKAVTRKGGVPDPAIRKELDEALTFESAMVHDVEKGFGFGMYVSIEAETEEELFKLDRQARELFDSIGLTYFIHTDGQKDAWKTMLPLHDDRVQTTKVYSTSTVTRLLPFLSRTYFDSEGIFIGYSHSFPVFHNIFSGSINAHVNIFGKSGAGKSVAAKLLTLRSYLRHDAQIVIVDITPKGEYKQLTDAVEGQTISFEPGRGIDLFPEMDNPNEYIAALVTFFAFFIDAKKLDRDLLQAALIKLYEAKKVRNLTQLIRLLEKHPMTQSLQNLQSGVLKGLFEGAQPIVLEKNFVRFDLTHPLVNSRENRTAFLFLALALTKTLFAKIGTGTRKLLVFDEAHLLQADRETALFHENLVKVGRHDNLGVISITQNVEDFIYKTEYGRGVLTNPETTLLFRQNLKTIEELASVYHLPEGVRLDLASLARGDCYLIRESEYIPLTVEAFKSDLPYILTAEGVNKISTEKVTDF